MDAPSNCRLPCGAPEAVPEAGLTHPHQPRIAQEGTAMKNSKKTVAVKHTGETLGKGIKGKTSGINKRAFYVQTLKENEKAKRPDAELQKVFDAEFPDTVSYPVKGIRSASGRFAFSFSLSVCT